MGIWQVMTALLGLYTLITVLYFLRRLQLTRNTEMEPVQHSVFSQDADLVGTEGLQQALTDWQQTFDAIIDPVLVLDTDLVIVKGNKAAKLLLGHNGESLEGKHCYNLFSGKDSPCSICPVKAQARNNVISQQDIRHQYLGKVFNVSCAPIHQQGRVVGYIHSAKDISHQRQLEKQLIQAHKMDAIATLAGGIAHDFNNILGAILGNADLLLYRMPDGNRNIASELPPITFEEITEHLLSIKRAGNRAKELVTQILAFSRQTSNRRKLIDIAPLIKECCKLLRASLPSTIELKSSIPSQTGNILADPTQIQQMLMNLCNNSAQAMDNGMGTIEVSLRQTDIGEAELKRYPDLHIGKYITLAVRDTGKGIPEDVVSRIFDPFFTTKEVGYGSGMGLAVIHGIVVAHDASIDVQSNQGTGSVFTVFFPMVMDEERQAEDVLTSLPTGRETILFVDDEEEIVVMRTRMLEYLGYKVIAAHSGDEAISCFERGEEEINVLITDQTMPRMTGLQLAEKVRKRLPYLPIILCSGYSDAISPEEIERIGIDRFIAKPVDMRQLATAIRELLKSRKTESL
ncbi:hybrid sensor histidine kinase/response regulator [Desulfogranum japonicum]|uniref:hybrid sensor histidine kinase/response regulator n=1 Tax=Desulfogranum japonicum TaxID=231447 RepID=UPI00042008CB|nr:ATP-binding protein [Desulfogranum japonicum]